MERGERKAVNGASSGEGRCEEGTDHEMKECLERLKIWRVENLMSPTGMDRFAQDIKMTKSDSSKGRMKKGSTHKGQPISGWCASAADIVMREK